MPVGRSRFSACCHLSVDLDLPRCQGVRSWQNRSHPNSADGSCQTSLAAAAITPPRVCPRDDSAAVRRPLRSPIACAATPPAFGPRHQSALLGIAAAPLGQLQPPPPIAIFPKRAQDIVCALHHQRPEIVGSFLADVELRLTVAGVPSSGTQSYITAQVPTPPESMRIVHRQHVRQCNQRSDTIDLLQLGYLWIVLLGDLFDLTVVVLGAPGQRLYFLKQRLQGGSQLGTKFRGQFLPDLFGMALPQPFSVGFGQPSDRIHQRRARPDQHRSGPNPRQGT